MKTDKKDSVEGIVVEVNPTKKPVAAPITFSEPVSANMQNSVKIPFEVWCATRAIKSHRWAGMRVFANTSGVRTAEEWDRLFASY